MPALVVYCLSECSFYVRYRFIRCDDLRIKVIVLRVFDSPFPGAFSTCLMAIYFLSYFG